MHLEVGKKYRTYGGDTVEVLYICETPLLEKHKVIGVFTYKDSEYQTSHTCRINGIWNNEKRTAYEHSIKEEIK